MDTLQLKSLRVLLIGESCNDEYYYGECRRVSPEAPVPVLDYTSKKVFPGMAANVHQNLMSFGVEVNFLTNRSQELIKERYIDNRSKSQLLRVDRGERVDPLIPAFIPDLNYDCIIFSDYDKGLITHHLAKHICSVYKGPVFVDSKKKDLSCFEGAIIKLNEFEEEEYSSLPEECDMITTLGKKGACWNHTMFLAPLVSVFDVSGAGDVFLATLAVSHTSGEKLSTSIQRAVLMASKSVQYSGTYKITKEDIDEICS